MTGVASILVTGAGGRIGGVLKALWPREAGLRPLWVGRDEQGPDGRTRNLLGASAAADLPPVDAVLCLAGVVTGDEAALALNTDLALASCELAARSGARRVLVASSAAVYGPGGRAPLAEETPPRPVAPYGLAKWRMEQAVADWAAADATRPRVTLLRIGNIAGLDALLGGNPPGAEITLDPVSGQAGGPLRSYIGVALLARVLARLSIMAARDEALPDVLNIAADPPVAMADLLTADGRVWRFGPPRPGVLGKVVLETRRLRAVLPGLALTADADQMVREWHALKEPAA